MNTDGIDIWGSDVHIHDTYVNNADDCICVKGEVDGSHLFSENWLVENSTASGEGLSPWGRAERARSRVLSARRSFRRHN